MIEILIVLVVVGVGLYLVNTYVPMAQPFKVVLNVIAVLCLVIWMLQVFGITHFRLPR